MIKLISPCLQLKQLFDVPSGVCQTGVLTDPDSLTYSTYIVYSIRCAFSDFLRTGCFELAKIYSKDKATSILQPPKILLIGSIHVTQVLESPSELFSVIGS